MDVTPYTSKLHHTNSTVTINTFQTTPTNNFVGYSLPKTVNTTLTAPQIYVLINVAGGLATAGIYKGHFDNNNLHPLTHKVSFTIYKKLPTEQEAWTYWLNYYTDYNIYKNSLPQLQLPN